jgi:threonine synthase
MIKLINTGKIDKSEHVVVISTANGLKFTDFKVNYHEEKLGFPSTYANKPIDVPANVSAVKKALTNALKKTKEQREILASALKKRREQNV